MSIKSRGMIINGHPTSFRLESIFWKLLRVAAVECGYSVKGLIEVISIAKQPNQNLSSAIRVYLAAYFYGAAPHNVLVDPTSKLAIQDGTRNLDRSLQQARRAMKEGNEIDERYGTPRRRIDSARPRAADPAPTRRAHRSPPRPRAA
jgi:predicted DNA-binding ribbon-helix-helix protein